MTTQSCYTCIHKRVCHAFPVLQEAAGDMSTICTNEQLGPLLPQTPQELETILVQAVSLYCQEFIQEPPEGRKHA